MICDWNWEGESCENVRRGVGGDGQERVVVEALHYLFLVSGDLGGVGEAGHVG